MVRIHNAGGPRVGFAQHTRFPSESCARSSRSRVLLSRGRPTLVSSSRAHSTPKVRTMKTLVAVAILAMALIPPALAKAKRAQSTRAQSAPQQGYQSSERPGYYHGYPLSEWYRDSLSSY